MSILHLGMDKAISYLNSKATHYQDVESPLVEGRLELFFQESLKDITHLRSQRMVLYFTEHDEARKELGGRLKEYTEATGISGWFPYLTIAKKLYSEILEKVHEI